MRNGPLSQAGVAVDGDEGQPLLANRDFHIRTLRQKPCFDVDQIIPTGYANDEISWGVGYRKAYHFFAVIVQANDLHTGISKWFFTRDIWSADRQIGPIVTLPATSGPNLRNATSSAIVS